MKTKRKRYVLAGTGARGISTFGVPLLETYGKHCELVGLYDHNSKRMDSANTLLKTSLPTYTDFDAMLAEAKPDAVIIATNDSTHAELIVRTMAAGKRAISEKPLCINAAQCRDILAAAKKYAPRGGQCLVTHNMRYGPDIEAMKKLLAKGVIGDIKSVLFQENLDRRHGADYFRRWHRQKKNSGGLLVHKASHHFDTLNWLVGSVADTLTAQGGTLFYGKNGPFRSRRCHGCRHAKACDFHADMWTSESNRLIYKNAEKEDGYLRDGCVFDRAIDIEDNIGVLYNYKNGVQVAYTLTAFAMYEGLQLHLEGTKGRLELRLMKSANWAPGSILVHGMEKAEGKSLTLYSPKKGIVDIPIPERSGSHGGADDALRDDLFGRPFDAPPAATQARLEDAVQAVLIGHAANASIAAGSKVVNVQELLKRD